LGFELLLVTPTPKEMVSVCIYKYRWILGDKI